MSSRPRRRPRFDLETTLEPAEIVERVKAFLASSKRIRGVALTERIELGVTGDEHHFWSPQLVVAVTPKDRGKGCRLEARFGPDPYVWAMYLLIYGALLILTLIAAAFGFSQWTLGMRPTALYAAPLTGLLAALTYGASFVGQGLGSEQMYLLRSTLVEVTEAEEIEE
jgi:hypothetical protein